MSALNTVTPPANEPVTAAEAKTQAIIEHTDDDTLIGSMITRARLLVEAWTGRQLCNATYDYYLDSWPLGAGVIRLPRWPVSSVTSVKYQDVDDAQQTLVENTDYQVDLLSEPARIMPEYGESWPNLYPESFYGIVIRFVAGYSADGASVPENYKHAILGLVAYWHRNREIAGPMGMKSAEFFLAHHLNTDRSWSF